jgi:hypothetical protein
MIRSNPHRPIILAILVALIVLTVQPIQPAQAATYPCSEAGLDAAILAGGGPHDFGAGACTITVTAAKTITGTLILDGTGAGGSLTISGGDAVRIFDVTATGNLTLQNLTLDLSFA